MNTSTYKRMYLPVLLGLALPYIGHASEKQPLPNIIYILTDDMGIGDLGCYGQQKIKTPCIDELAANGIQFARHYAGSAVSAPSRCALLTGKHTGHAYIRGNKSAKGDTAEGFDYPMKGEEITIAEILKTKNYATGCVGKWGLGGPKTEGSPINQGFDYFFGYLGQGSAHKYYPDHLWENDKKIILNNKIYSHDLIVDKGIDFIEKNCDKNFFLYMAITLPHAELIVPDEDLKEYDGKFDEKPYIGDHFCNQPKPRATYAAMISKIDRTVEQVLDVLEQKGIKDNTLIIFSSDNGVHFAGGHDPDYFKSNGGFRGYKRDLYEGGIHTPLIVSWPKAIQTPRVSFHLSAFWDFLPTVCDLVGVDAPENIDGISMLPEIEGKGKQAEHDYLYWEFHERGGKQAVMKGKWKLLKQNIEKPGATTWELYNLNEDPTESMNVISQYPKIVAELQKAIKANYTPSDTYPFKKKGKSTKIKK